MLRGLDQEAALRMPWTDCCAAMATKWLPLRTVTSKRTIFQVQEELLLLLRAVVPQQISCSGVAHPLQIFWSNPRCKRSMLFAMRRVAYTCAAAVAPPMNTQAKKSAMLTASDFKASRGGSESSV